MLAILAIFVFHCTRLFDTDDWSIKNLTTYLAVDVWKDFCYSWGMPLILIISGASAFLALDKVRLGKYLKGLFCRLLLPLMVGMFTHVAFQIYLENLNKGSFSGSFWSFYPHYFEGMYGFGGNFAWMGLHLWYLEILFILSLIFLPLFAWLKRTPSGKRVLKGLGDLLAKPGAALLVGSAGHPADQQPGPGDLGQTSPWEAGASSSTRFFFIAGFVIISNERLQNPHPYRCAGSHWEWGCPDRRLPVPGIPDRVLRRLLPWAESQTEDPAAAWSPGAGCWRSWASA